MTPQEIESFIATDRHPAWHDFCVSMLTHSYGYDALVQAWCFFRKGWDAMMFQHGQLEASMLERVRVAEAIRDDARVSSQKYLDQKRSVEQEMSALQKDRERMGREMEHLMLTLNSTKYQLAQANKEIDVLKRGAGITLDVTTKYGCGTCNVRFDSLAELVEHTQKSYTTKDT